MTKAAPIFTFGENDLTAPLNRWPAGHEDPIAIRTSIAGRNEAHPKNAPEKSKAGDCRAMGTAEKPRVQSVRGKFVAGFETGRATAGGSAQKEVHTQALRVDAVSRTARPD